MSADGLTVPEAAQILGISESAVRKRVERGKLKAEHAPDGRLIVYFDRDATATDSTRDRPRQSRDTSEPDDRYTRSLEDQVLYLRQQLETRDDEIRRRDAIIMNMTETMKALPAPPDSPLREWAIDEEVAREDKGMEGRPGVSDEQKNYERYVQPYEDTGAPEPARAEPERAEPRSDAGGAQEGAQRRPWWRRVFGS